MPAARDNKVNDNFSVFAVRATSEALAVDGKEIHEACWMPWEKLVEAWVAAGRKPAKKVELDLPKLIGQPFAQERCVVSGNMLLWLDTLHSGRGMRVNTVTEQQGGYTSSKSSVNCMVLNK